MGAEECKVEPAEIVAICDGQDMGVIVHPVAPVRPVDGSPTIGTHNSVAVLG